MSDFMQDVVTALDQSRFQMADDFKAMHEANMKFYRFHAQAWVNSVAKDYGDESWRFYGTAYMAGVYEVFFDTIGTIGEATFIDPLRLGAGAKKGGFGYVEDGLRVIGLFGGFLKIFKLAKMGRVAGGLMSCTPTSLAKATRVASLSFTTMEEVAQGTGSGLEFGSSGPVRGAWIEQVLPKIQKIVTVEAKAVSGSSDIEALVAQRKGPVVFSVEWKGPSGIPGGGHTMMAYQTEGGAFKLADQFGNAHSWRMGPNGLQVIAGPGSTSLQPGAVIGTVNRFYSPSGGGMAYILRETVLMQVAANAPLGQRIGIPLLKPLDRQFNLKLAFAASMLESAPTGLKNAGNTVMTMVDLRDLPITDPQLVVGWWYVWVDPHFWTYVFQANGNVRWTDPYNHKTGTGKWDSKNGITIKWAAPSTTVEDWDTPINVNQQTGKYRVKSVVSALKAVKIGSTTSGVIKNIVGRWKVTVTNTVNKWTWYYDFDAGGRVKWTDPFNGQIGTGQWTITKDGLYTWWSPTSRTTEEWKGPLDAPSLNGTARMSDGNYPLKAEKMTN
jgi:hypothetical protein